MADQENLVTFLGQQAQALESQRAAAVEALDTEAKRLAHNRLADVLGAAAPIGEASSWRVVRSTPVDAGAIGTVDYVYRTIDGVSFRVSGAQVEEGGTGVWVKGVPMPQLDPVTGDDAEGSPVVQDWHLVRSSTEVAQLLLADQLEVSDPADKARATRARKKATAKKTTRKRSS